MSCGTCGIQASETMQGDTGVPAGAPTTQPRCPDCGQFLSVDDGSHRCPASPGQGAAGTPAAPAAPASAPPATSPPTEGHVVQRLLHDLDEFGLWDDAAGPPRTKPLYGNATEIFWERVAEHVVQETVVPPGVTLSYDVSTNDDGDSVVTIYAACRPPGAQDTVRPLTRQNRQWRERLTVTEVSGEVQGLQEQVRAQLAAMVACATPGMVDQDDLNHAIVQRIWSHTPTEYAEFAEEYLADHTIPDPDGSQAAEIVAFLTDYFTGITPDGDFADLVDIFKDALVEGDDSGADDEETFIQEFLAEQGCDPYEAEESGLAAELRGALAEWQGLLAEAGDEDRSLIDEGARLSEAEPQAAPVALFAVGTVTYGRDELGLLAQAGVDQPYAEVAAECLARHSRSDWGDLHPYFQAQNERNVRLAVGYVSSYYPQGNGRAVVRVETNLGVRGAANQPAPLTHIAVLAPRPGCWPLEQADWERIAQDLSQRLTREYQQPTEKLGQTYRGAVNAGYIALQVAPVVGQGRGKPAQREAIAARVQRLLEQQGFWVQEEGRGWQYNHRSQSGQW